MSLSTVLWLRSRQVSWHFRQAAQPCLELGEIVSPPIASRSRSCRRQTWPCHVYRSRSWRRSMAYQGLQFRRRVITPACSLGSWFRFCRSIAATRRAMRQRNEFPAKIKAAAAIRAAGHCEECTRRLATGDYHYDHIIPDALGGEATLDNCQVLCRSCHGGKTSKEDRPRIAKAERNFRKAHGIKKPSQFRGWRRFDGTVVKR